MENRRASCRALGAALLAVCVCLASLPPARSRADTPEFPNLSVTTVVPGRVLVSLEPGEDVLGLSLDYGTPVEENVAGSELYSIAIPDSWDPSLFAMALCCDSRVRSAEPDTYVGLPEFAGQQFHFAFDAGPLPGGYIDGTAFAQIGLEPRHRRAKGQNTVVAILDTGVCASHGALAGRLLAGWNLLQAGLPPLDLPDGTTNAAAGHGTMIAGIIARVAPRAALMPIRVLNADGIGTLRDVIAGVRFAAASHATVVNMSFGAPSGSPALEDALEAAHEAGVTLVSSAGNAGQDWVEWPAAYPTVIGVASVEADGTKSDYSNYGLGVAVAAPGTGIRSAFWTGEYATWSGTSFSAAFVAGQAALVRSANPLLSPADVAQMIQQSSHSVDAVNPGFAGRLGGGLIDVDGAIILAMAGDDHEYDDSD
jgi:hypothetical protein